jgi:hypothetical protein
MNTRTKRRAKAPGKPPSKPKPPKNIPVPNPIPPAMRSKGRPPGSVNHRPKILRNIQNGVGITPLGYMVSVMADETQPQEVRMDAAKAAAPYCHARLASVTVQEKPFDGDPNSLTSEFLASIVASYGSGDVVTEAPGSKKVN